LQPFSLNHSVHEQRFRWILNVLLQKISAGNRCRVTLSWMRGAVTDIADHPPQIVTECCSFVSLTAHPARTRRDIGGAQHRQDAGGPQPLRGIQYTAAFRCYH
jgi:hypothetical protein